MQFSESPNTKRRRSVNSQRILITGGAGFIGSNLAHRLISQGHDVTIYDNLSRRGSRKNLEWLLPRHGENSFRIIEADLADLPVLKQACKRKERIYHLAGQVAVTLSVQYPLKDFHDNALGTLHLLEAARDAGNDPVILYTSTNKVYGEMQDVPVVEEETRYRYQALTNGVSETQPLDFHSPYGCSKGCGDQYTHDYARIYGLRTVVMRQSCIYGYRQFGIEDQGWLAWFIIASLQEKPISIFGDGKQVRDILFVDDLLDAYDAAVAHIDKAAGQVYNIGGGPQNTISVWAEFGPMLERLLGKPIPVKYYDWRPGDQRIFVSNISKAREEIGWEPRISVQDGITRLFNWVRDNMHLFQHD
jgi:CDP-paratose 2-epimerase